MYLHEVDFFRWCRLRTSDFYSRLEQSERRRAEMSSEKKSKTEEKRCRLEKRLDAVVGDEERERESVERGILREKRGIVEDIITKDWKLIRRRDELSALRRWTDRSIQIELCHRGKMKIDGNRRREKSQEIADIELEFYRILRLFDTLLQLGVALLKIRNSCITNKWN